jgi:hypothetical protein
VSTRDPFEVIRPYQQKDQPPPDPLREFYSEGYVSRVPRPRREPIAALGLCQFDSRGREVRRGYNCPHFREEDSDG